MNISSFSAPKDRSMQLPSDDTLLIMPGVLGVFDGATFPQKNMPQRSSGAVASQAAAQAVARLTTHADLMTLPAAEVFGAISTRIGAETRRNRLEGKPSTTMAVAVLGDEAIRFLCVGDSGIRINGAQVLRHQKLIDAVSTENRLAVYRLLSARHDDPDTIEHMARFTTFEGHQAAICKNMLTAADVAEMQAQILGMFADRADAAGLKDFLDAGIRKQQMFANRTDHALGFSTLNEDATSLADIIDTSLPRAEVCSLELFSDGYFACPANVDLAGWEDTFAQTEAEDFHKLHRFANVKGSTTREFTDDRSVIVAHQGGAVRS